MSKNQTIFICSACDAQFPKWLGRCAECGGWGTLKETSSVFARGGSTSKNSAPSAQTLSLDSITTENVQRMQTGIVEFDRVLGGGIVPSSLILIGGEPGIGKSTLILQVAQKIHAPVLYISGEESGSQIKMRLERLGLSGEKISFLGETHIDTVCSTIKKQKPGIAIIDSIQTAYSDAVPSEPGSISQVRTATVKLLETAKQLNTAIFIVGHITKDGIIAGPKTLEHLVDTVIYLEGERYHTYRILRTIKNRFGSTNEVGIFEMKNSGLEEVKNPSAVFLMDRKPETSGSIITPTLEGTRVFLAEVQSLVTKVSYGYPQRRTQGFDAGRLGLLCAVLQKRAQLPLENYDIHVNIAGGLKISEPAADLAVCLAIISAYKNTVLDAAMCACGEIGLGGEIRKVNQMEKRIQECQKLGFKKIIVPHAQISVKSPDEIILVSTINEAMEKIYAK